MNSDIIVALLSCIGTAAGTITGIIVSNRLSIYRIDQLEKKLDKYANNVDEMREACCGRAISKICTSQA